MATGDESKAVEREMEDLVTKIQANVVATQQTWEEVSAVGTRLLAGLCNNLIETSFTDDPLNWGVLEKNKHVQELVRKKTENMRRKLLMELQQVIDKLEFWYEDLKELHFQLQVACDGTCWLPGASGHLIGQTMSIFGFEELVGQQVTFYGKDLSCKRDIMLDLADYVENPTKFDSSSSEAMSIYLAVWTEEPYIDSSMSQLIQQVVLSETSIYSKVK
eukprot:CAMPEP_0184522042 /NCGR_PEP_ID=MMETSP0198_2-20121128/8056_1 /TAXON_ID=1112570 /ORGANISM="Thraustochytrium sp., Strain LLF1b" /LENGTH=217 /DNA_ID=CAMNT_0026912813 /DNA_START=141 /DNA_END=794 /DNA_ORIENTATION=+